VSRLIAKPLYHKHQLKSKKKKNLGTDGSHGGGGGRREIRVKIIDTKK
jgi:hypothetical protein